MTFKQKLSLITHTCAIFGVVETSKMLLWYVLRPKIEDDSFDKRNATTFKLLLWSYVLRPKIEDDSFDKRNSTDTKNYISHQELKMSDSEAQSHATQYSTVPERFLRYLISHVGINYQEYDFVDIGCGKGRVLLVASSFPFRSISGIELSRPALEIAGKNIRTYRSADQKCFNIHIRKVDARYFEPDITNTVYYFFEPFDTVILTAVLAKLSSKLRGHGKMIYVICIWHDLASVVKLFEMHGFQAIRVQIMLFSFRNYAIFSLR
jgi:precorrin-6B methylase 2